MDCLTKSLMGRMRTEGVMTGSRLLCRTAAVAAGPPAAAAGAAGR